MPKTYLETRNGLECCLNGTDLCRDCPYRDYASCRDMLHTDALYWLDELEPRPAIREGVSKPGGGLLR